MDTKEKLIERFVRMPNDTLITYEDQTVAELREDFEGAVDDYLQYCIDNGIQPRKSYSGTLNVRISPETHSKIAILASQAGISINAYIKNTLDTRVAGFKM